MSGNPKLEDEARTQFLLAECEDLYQNIMHVENELQSHLSFFTTLMLALGTAGIAILQLGASLSLPLSSSTVALALSGLFALLFVVGRFELRMTAELRVRKIKFVEGITEIRRYFVGADGCITDYLALPVGLKKAPPFLRVPSADWYHILYVSVMSSLAALVASALAWYWVIGRLPATAEACGAIWQVHVVAAVAGACLGLPPALWLSWWRPYWRIVDFCESFDRTRANRAGKTEYDLLDPPLPPRRRDCGFGDWIRWLHKHRRSST